LIKGSICAQKRKTAIWSIWPKNRFFSNRIDSFFSAFLRYCEFSKGIFIRYTGKISEFERLVYYACFEDVLLSIEQTGEKLTRADEIDEQIQDAEREWDEVTYGQAIRSLILIAHSILRKWVILPSLIVAKNIGRMLLLQRPKWSQDFNEWNDEVHLICTNNGIPFSETQFPEDWIDDCLHIMVVSPFRL